jgi:UDP-N-acetylmuramoylalanine--D-glutamate ligase
VTAPAQPVPTDLAGLRVSVLGLGRFGGGAGVTRWLAGQGAAVTVSDAADPEDLAESLDQLADLDLTLHLGGHREADFLSADLLVVNPAVPKTHPLLVQAVDAGVPRTTEINLFLQRCPAFVVGITGSVGKSTTAAMTAELLRTARTTHLGGNIGRSLLGDLPTIRPDHVVVLELSSFQLEDLPIVGLSPQVALVTNLQPNHLDRHGSMEAYVLAKRNICRYQSPEDLLILNAADPACRAWAEDVPGRVAYFDPAVDPFELAVPGEHNQANAQAAWAVASEFGVPRKPAAGVLRNFRGLEHRLELLGEIDGVRYVNDSKCTTPGGAVVALGSFPAGTCVILLGGSEKGADFDDLAAAVAGRAKAAVCFGATGPKLADGIRENAPGENQPVTVVTTLKQAFDAAHNQARPGDVVLLSPACASYDQFTHYEQRGETFRHLVRDLR